MGNPQHFSRELPRRGQQLIDCHYESLGRSDGGGLPLKATFLLSISMPMVMLPIERILKTAAHMNDAPLDAALNTAVAAIAGPGVQFHQTPFYQPDKWELEILPKGAGFPNLALTGLPEPIAKALDLPGARQAAASLGAETFLRIIRNALAHGGILFLNADGRTEDGAAVRRFAFVSTDRPFNPTELRFLRVTMEGYRGFLQSWAQWLQGSAVQKSLEDVVDLEAAPGPENGTDQPAEIEA